MGMKLLVLVVIVLAIIAVAQLMRVYELSNKVKGKREEDIDLKANNFNGAMMIVFMILFFGSFVYMAAKYGKGMMPEAASAEGLEIDWLMNINLFIVITVFFAVNFLLFFFAYKYRYNPNREAYFFAHDNKLELLWTVTPAAAMAVIIILGLMTWNNLTDKPSDDAEVVEIYAEQFKWTARYSGEDNKLGYSDYKLVTTHAENPNPLGVVTEKTLNWRIYELDSVITVMRNDLTADSLGQMAHSAANLYKKEKEMEKLERIKERIFKMRDNFSEEEVGSLAYDDFTSSELFLKKDQEYYFVLRSRDVIHCAYFPHFRVQMNCVPGQRTVLKVKPIYTTQEMKDKTGDPNFEYILMCNKICGVSHSMMKMNVRVGTDEEFEAWRDPEAANVTMVHGTRNDPPVMDSEYYWFDDHMKNAAEAHGHGDHGDEEHAEEGHEEEAH